MNSLPLGDDTASSVPDGALVRTSSWALVWRELPLPRNRTRSTLPEPKENSETAARGRSQRRDQVSVSLAFSINS